MKYILNSQVVAIWELGGTKRITISSSLILIWSGKVVCKNVALQILSRFASWSITQST